MTESGPIVWRKTATGFESKKVEVGQRNKDLVEIRSGLAPGERVSRINLGHQAGTRGAS